jgi:hypothetical protein
MAPPDAPVSLSIRGAASSLSLNSGDAAAVAAGPKMAARLNALPVFASMPSGAPIAFHSTAELNIRGVVFSSIVSDPAPQAAVSSTVPPEAPVAPTPAAVAPETLAAPEAPVMPTRTAIAPKASVAPTPAVAAPDAPVAPKRTVAAPAAESAALSKSVTNVPAAEVKPREEIAPALQDAAPAIEEAPILASGLPQKSSTPKAAAPEARVEHKHHAHVDQAEPKPADTPDSQPLPAVTAQPSAAAPVPAAVALPVHMVLPIAARFNRPLIPLGNRIPAAASVATMRTPLRTEAPATADPFDPFNNDADPKAAALPAESIKPLVATADQLAFAAKVQLAKPQAVSRNPEPVRAEPVHAEPVRSESHSQQQHSSHKDADPQFSMKAGETAAKPAARPAHAASTFEAAATVSEESIPAAKPGFTASTRPTSGAAASAEDVTPTRPEVPAAPMKDISIRIQSEQGENVDVRILHRAGDVQIAVKSENGETTQGLRHGLSELSDRLNATGYHADTWHPGQTTTAADNTADSGNSQHSQQQQSQGDSQSHSGWSQQQGGRRDDNQSNRPRWIEELESNISSSPETGLFHGLIR